MPRPHPEKCQHCEHDRRFPDFEKGGWIEQGNNGRIAPIASASKVLIALAVQTRQAKSQLIFK